MIRDLFDIPLDPAKVVSFETKAGGVAGPEYTFREGSTVIESVEGAHEIVLEVLGSPASKGSARAFVSKKTGRAHIVTGGGSSPAMRERMQSWDAAVRESAQRIVGEVETPPFVDVAIAVDIVFRMARPKGHWGKGRNAGKLSPSAPTVPRGTPDIDKLARSTLDALTGTVFDDDARIAILNLRKVYASPGNEGARITIREA